MKYPAMPVAIYLCSAFACGGDGGQGPGCGDGVLQDGEACDSGEQNSDTAADACRTTCVAASCGDGVLDAGEDCDDGAKNSDTASDACRTDCQPPACGDGVVDDGEACDDGEANSNDDADACRESCAMPSCGDGVADTGEACDDGDDVDTNDCANDCTASTLWTQMVEDVTATGLAVDTAGNVLVVGTAQAAGGSDVWLRKYDASGAMLWTQTYDGVAGTAEGWGVAVDSAGNVAVIGVELTAAGDSDIWVRKYDSAGTPLWSRTHGGAAGGDDSAGRIATDAAGNIVVAGSEGIVLGGLGWVTDGWIRKYDPDGNPLWTQIYASTFGGIDYASAVAVDGAGNVLVTGLELAIRDAWLRKYDPDGMPLWTEYYAGAENMHAEGTGVAADAAGNILATGIEVTTAGAVDIWVRKYDASGTDLWTDTYDGAAHNTDSSRDIAVDADGNVLVTGFEIAGATPDIWTRKYDPSGTPLFTLTHNGSSNAEDSGAGIRATSDGVLVAGYERAGSSTDLWLGKYPP